MYIVFGGIITIKGSVSEIMRIDIYSNIRDRVGAINPGIEKNLFLGGIHYLKGSVLSGFNNEDEIKVAMGYSPLLSMDYVTEQFFFSLPMSMYIVGEIMEKDGEQYNFYTEYADGSSTMPESGRADFDSRLIRKTRQNLEYFSYGYHYYNFFTGTDITLLPKHYIALSELSALVNQGIPSSIDMYKFYQMYPSTEDLSFSNNTETHYFFVARAQMVEDVAGNGFNDLIIPPGANENPFTYEKMSVSGVMAHITALSNLLYNDSIHDVSSSVLLIFLFVSCFGVFLISWKLDLLKAAFFSFLFITFIVLVSFLVFLLGYFIPVKAALAVAFVIFAGVSILRFIYSVNKREIYAIAAERVISPKYLKSLEKDESWYKSHIVRNGIIMVLFPKKLPEIGLTDYEAEYYKDIYNNYLSLVFRTIEGYNGNHDTLSGDGILGFWNVFEQDNNSFYTNLINCMNAAVDCYKNIYKWQDFIDRISQDRNTKYKATFDICLHIGSFYTGIVEAGNMVDYVLSGSSINRAISTAWARVSDKKSSIILTEEFKQQIDNQSSGSKDIDKYLNLLKKKKVNKKDVFIYQTGS